MSNPANKKHGKNSGAVRAVESIVASIASLWDMEL